MMTRTKEVKMIKLFGDRAEGVKAGQLFIARVDSVEGRNMVILEPINYENDP